MTAMPDLECRDNDQPAKNRGHSRLLLGLSDEPDRMARLVL